MSSVNGFAGPNMNPQKPTLDKTKLTEDQRTKLESYEQAQEQLKTLQDIADMTQEVVGVLDSQKTDAQNSDKNMGALLMDMRDSLTALKDKQAPDTPDYAKPVVDAVGKLEKALATSIKSIDVKPVIGAPQVNVPAPVVDMKGVEKAISAIPQAFSDAISLIDIPEVPVTDFQPLLDVWSGISEQLLSIENAARAKPLPGAIKISNLSEVGDDIATNNPKYAAFQFDPNDSAPNYIGKNIDASADDNQGDWVVYKFTYSGSNVTAINKRVGAWSARTGLFP